MHFLFDLLVDLAHLFLPWSRGHEDRSVVGESDLDRRARRLWTWAFVIAVLLAAGIAAAFYFFRGQAG